MNYNDLIADALKEAQKIHPSMVVSTCEYDGIVKKINLRFEGSKNDHPITTSRYINVSCESQDELESFRDKHCEHCI